MTAGTTAILGFFDLCLCSFPVLGIYLVCLCLEGLGELEVDNKRKLMVLFSVPCTMLVKLLCEN